MNLNKCRGKISSLDQYSKVRHHTTLRGWGGPSIEDQAVIEIWVHLNSFNLVGVVAEKSRQRKSSNLLQLLQCETAWPPSILVEKSAEKNCLQAADQILQDLSPNLMLWNWRPIMQLKVGPTWKYELSPVAKLAIFEWQRVIEERKWKKQNKDKSSISWSCTWSWGQANQPKLQVEEFQWLRLTRGPAQWLCH